METYDPELQISETDAGDIVSVMGHPGFAVWQRIKRAEVQKYFTKLLNADTTSEAIVLEYHRLAKVAAQLHQGEINTLNEIKAQYLGAPRATDKPTDPLEDTLDLGDIAQQLDGVPNLLEEAGL